MATINDFKVKDEDFNDLDIMSLPSRPSAAGMSAAQLQERFDAGAKQVIRPKLNALIDLMSGSEGADNIGITPIEGLAGYTVQQFLVALKLLLDDKKDKEQADREIGAKFDAAEAQALVKEITFSEGSGVFTITKYDGSVKNIDTAIEKVALDVRLDGQQFVLTLADGSEQRVDLSAFITQTEVKSSDTITLAIENGAIVARITSGSVMLSHLNAEVTAYIDAKEAAAANSAAAAKLSEQNALNSANTAKASEQAAKTCQEQACSCATQAGLSRDAAKASEQAAKEYAQEAKDYSGGDFVTNTAFNQFKETVPTLDDGKVPVQQGGLYINSETTEEDKAEAQEALGELGVAFRDAKVIASATDLNNVIEAGTYLCFEAAHLNAPPLVYGATGNANGWLIVKHLNHGSASNYVLQTFNKIGAAGNAEIRPFSRKLIGGVWSDWTTGFLPLDGSVPMSGADLWLYNGLSRIVTAPYTMQIELRKAIGDTANRRFINIDNVGSTAASNALCFSEIIDGNQTRYKVFGEHNKPSGSYTGNGSSIERQIEVGGIGKWLGIYSQQGVVIVTPAGGFYGTGGSNFAHFGSSVAIFQNGILTIKSTANVFNMNNETYYYQFL